LKYIWTSNNPDYLIENSTAACIEVSPDIFPTTFSVSITDSLGILTCDNSVTVMKLETLLPDTTWVCHSDSVLLDAGPGFTEYLWQETGQQSQTILVRDTGWYHVSCNAPELQEPVVDSTWVFFQNSRIIQGDAVVTNIYPTTLCVSPDTLQYIWTASDPNYIIENNTAACIEVAPDIDSTIFYVSTTDSSGILTCESSTMVMKLKPRLPDTTRVCNADSVLLDAGPGFLNYYWWETGEYTQTIWAKDTGWYHVTCDTLDMQGVDDATYVIFQNSGIIQEDTILTCYKYPVTLTAQPDSMMYYWWSDDPNYFIENSTDSIVEVIPEFDTTTFYVAITDSLNLITCVDSVKIFLFPRMRFDEVSQINTGCPETCKGQLEVIVSGGLAPYRYLWYSSPKQYDSIAFGLCEQAYKLEVTDEYFCIRDTMLPVEVYDMPEVELSSDPDTADVYIENPVVTFSFENLSIDSIQIIDWNWNFGDSTYSVEESPTKVFEDVRNYTVEFTYTTFDECVESVTMDIDVQPVELIIPNIITPNGDGLNDVFVIEELEYYMTNKMSIFNRYGKRVYTQTDYQSDWDGGNLRDGAYFYVLKAEGYFGTDVYKGSLTIMRGQ
jgi:gliding motility-associated-like protein